MVSTRLIKVFGKVQGVFFRKYTDIKARELGLKGGVCNMSDNSVAIVVEGDSSAIDKFSEWCHKGSPNARVDKVVINEGVFKNYTSFDILKDDSL